MVAEVSFGACLIGFFKVPFQEEKIFNVQVGYLAHQTLGSDKGRERSHYGSGYHHDGVVKHAAEAPQQTYPEGGSNVRENRPGRRGSVSSSGKEKQLSFEKGRKSTVVSKLVGNVVQTLKETDSKPKDICVKTEENDAKSGTKVKDESSKSKKEKAAVSKEKKKAVSIMFLQFYFIPIEIRNRF